VTSTPQRPLATRNDTRPLIAHGDVAGYGPIFNPGLAWADGRYHLFARAIRDGYRLNPGRGARFLDYVSDILVFVSENGVDYEPASMLLRSSDDVVYEDLRVQQLGGRDGSWVATYTCVPGADTDWSIGMRHLSLDGGTFAAEGRETLIGPHGTRDKDGVLFDLPDGKVGFIHRIHPDMQLAVFDSLDDVSDPPVDYWDEHMDRLDEHVIMPAGTALGVGAGAPPIATAAGLLAFYHARETGGEYTMRVALLDAASGRPLHVLDEPLLVPELAWERRGDVDDVVFVQGAHRRDDGSIYLVYGAADRHIGSALVDEAKLLERLT
jgi:predicted GH43/DUF377 family glycosyl hydrolase